MSMRSGLNRLRNSFRRKNGRISGAGKDNNSFSDASPKTNRAAVSSPKTSRFSFSSPKSRKSSKGDPATETVTLDVKAMLKSTTKEPASGSSLHNTSGSEQNTSGNLQNTSGSAQNTLGKAQHCSDGAQYSLDSEQQSSGGRQKASETGHAIFTQNVSSKNSSTSLRSSSSSSLAATIRQSKSNSIAEIPSPVENSSHDNVTYGHNAVGDSDDSYDNLHFSDANDDNLDTTANDMSFKDAEEAMNVAEPETTSIDTRKIEVGPVLSGEGFSRRKTGSSNPNRVSFGTNLQEVLGKAEEAGMSANSKKNSSMASATCVIPQSLKESATTSSLGLHKSPSEDLTCRVCDELFRKPRILPCLHTFCAVCVINLQTYPINVLEERSNTSKDLIPEDFRELLSSSPVLGSTSSSSFSQKSEGSHKSSGSSAQNEEKRKRVGSDRKRVVLCPTCLKETTVSQTLEELPRNLVAERRVAQLVFSRGETARLECDSCADYNETTFVTVRCLDCAENLCSLCELSHRRQKKTKRHQLTEIMASSTAENQNTVLTSLKRESPDLNISANHRSRQSHVTLKVPLPSQISCSCHPEEELKLFCMTCDQPVCRDCVVVDHRDHDCQFLCQELFRQQMSQVQQMIRSVVPRITSVDQQLKKVSDTQDQIRSRADEVIREINVHMDAYLSAIREHRNQLLQQVGAVVEEKQHALHVTERHLRQVRADVEQTCRFVSDMIENASDVEILSVKRLVTDRLTGLKELTGTQHQPVSSFMRFCPSERGEVIHNFQMFGRVIARKASASASAIFSDGLSTARVAHESSVVLRVNSDDGAQYHGKDVQIKAWLIFQNQSIRSIPVRLSLQKNGTYCLKFTPVQSGSHFLHVAVDSQPVKDSPFKFKVKGQWREHKGVWHCCTLCSSGGRLDVPCACRGAMPGGQSQGCSHAQPAHPGGHHWSCCGKMVQTSECSGVPVPRQSPVRQVTL